MSPGDRNRPVPSMTSASLPDFRDERDAVTDAILSSRTTTVISFCGLDRSADTTVTCSIFSSRAAELKEALSMDASATSIAMRVWFIDFPQLGRVPDRSILD